MDCSNIGSARPATSSVDGTNDARRVHSGHERRSERREERRSERRDDRHAAFAELKAKVQQTLQGSTPAEAGNSSDSSFEAEFKASIHLSGPNGSVDAKIKFSLDAESGGAGSNGDSSNDFASALQGFTEALFSALKTLYGAEPQTPQTAVSTVSAPVLTDALASAPSTAIAASTDTPAPATEAVAGSTPAALPSTDTPAPAESAVPTPSSGSASLSIRVRMTYGSFDGQLGALTHRLAQPDVGNDVPAVGAMFNDLAARFSQLLSTAPGGDGQHTTLGGFLAALAHAFKQPSGGTPIKAGPEDGATDTADSTDASNAADTPAPAIAVGEPAPTAAAPSTQAVGASVSYRQLMSYENASSSFMLQASLRSHTVYATA